MKIFLLYLIILAVFDMNLFYLICLWWFDYIHCRVLHCSHGNAVMEPFPSAHPFILFYYFILFLGPVKWILSDHWRFCLLHPISLRPTRLEGLRWPQTDLRAVPPNYNAKDAWLWLLISWTFILSILTSTWNPSIWKACTHIGYTQCAQYEHCRVKLTNLATLVSWILTPKE